MSVQKLNHTFTAGQILTRDELQAMADTIDEIIDNLGSGGSGGTAHHFLTEDEMSDLTADDAVEGEIYLSLEGWDGSSSGGDTPTTTGTGFGSYFGFTFGQ